MKLEDLVFVTSNLGKLREAEAVLGARLDHRALDLPEIQSLDLEEVVSNKAAAAFARIKRPVLVEDTSLELIGLGGFPGPLIRWLLSSVGAEGICKLGHTFGDPHAVVRCIACAHDGNKDIMGIGVVEGRIATTPRGKFGFGWDSAFIPNLGESHPSNGCTYAEIDDQEKNRISHRKKALDALRAQF